MTAIADLQLMNIGGLAGQAVNQTHSGTSFTVAHSNLLTVSTNPDDPWEMYDSANTGAGYDEVRPIAVAPFHLFMDLYMVASGANPALSTSPLVRVFGKLPSKSNFGVWPDDLDAVNYNEPTSSDLWIPLADSQSGNPLIGLNTTLGLTGVPDTVGAKIFNLFTPRSVALQGVEKVIVTVNTAGVASVGAGFMCLARFSG